MMFFYHKIYNILLILFLKIVFVYIFIAIIRILIDFIQRNIDYISSSFTISMCILNTFCKINFDTCEEFS